MRVLFVTPYITSSANPRLLRNKTGFGYMVHDIAKYVAKIEKVDVFLINAMLPEQSISGFNIVGRSWGRFLSYFKFSSVIEAFRYIVKYRPPFSESYRALYAIWTIKEIEGIISKYDIIHIHGNGVYTQPCIDLCKKHSKPVIVTLHGLDSFTDSINCSDALKRLEKDFIMNSYKEMTPVSVISTGIKNKILHYLNVNGADNFKVICNGCNVGAMLGSKTDIREKYNIGKTDFLFVYVGNISKNKNQIQAVRAFNLLDDEWKRKTAMLLIGGDNDKAEIEEYIERNDLQGRVKLTGSVPKNEVGFYYSAANATIMTSIAEGFGLSMIEGFSYGIPSLCFKDLDAVPDLYDEKSMVVVDNRSDESLSKGMIEIMARDFDKVFIKEFAQHFSLEQMADNYCVFYRELIVI